MIGVALCQADRRLIAAKPLGGLGVQLDGPTLSGVVGGGISWWRCWRKVIISVIAAPTPVPAARAFNWSRRT